MKYLPFGVIVILYAISSQAGAEEAAGRWIGAIDNHLLTMVSFEKDADGAYHGSFSSHEQPLTKLDTNAVSDGALAGIAATSDRLRFAVPAVGGATFDGTWDNTLKRWVGTFQWGEGG